MMKQNAGFMRYDPKIAVIKIRLHLIGKFKTNFIHILGLQKKVKARTNIY